MQLLDRWQLEHQSAPPGWSSWRGLPILLVLLHGVIAWISRAPALLTGSDDVTYLLLARSLKMGAYRDMIWAGAPAHHTYPPGYPSLLAAWTAIGGEQFDWLVLLNVLFSMATIAFVFLAIRRLFPAAAVLATMAMLALNPGLLGSAGVVASEIPMALCLAIIIWASMTMPPGPRRESILLLAAIAAPLMRAAGAPVPLALLAWYVFERQWPQALRTAVASLVVLVPLLSWMLGHDPAQAGAAYASDMAFREVENVSYTELMARRILVNAQGYLTEGLPWLLPLPTLAGTIVDNAVGAVVLTAGLAAGALVAFMTMRLTLVVVSACMALLIIWVWFVPRFAIPVLPLLIPIFVIGAYKLASFAGRRAAVVTVSLIAAFVTATAASRASVAFDEVRDCVRGGQYPDPGCLTPVQQSYFEAVRFVSDSIPDSELVLTAKANTLVWYTGHPAVNFSLGGVYDGNNFENRLRELQVRWILLSDLLSTERGNLEPLLRDRCASLELVATFPPATYLFRWDPAHLAVPGNGLAPESNAACEALEEYRKLR